MVRANFYKCNGNFVGFKISGHTGYAVSGKDIVCASVSSAVQLTVNLLYEFKAAPKVNVGGDTIECRVKTAEDSASRILKQLMHHFELIIEEFPKTIKITISEV